MLILTGECTMKMLKKMIKKMAVIMTAFAVLTGIVACGGKKIDKERAGYYKAVSMTENGEEQDLKGFFDRGLGFFLVFNEDGSGYIEMLGKKDEVKWDNDNLMI